MTLDEFKSEMEQTVADFSATYLRDRKRGKHQTLIRPDAEWMELFREYLENSVWAHN